MVNSFKSQWLSPNRRFIDLLQRRVPPSAEVCATSPTMVNEREGAMADQHTPVHGGQFLRFIDHDVPVGPFTVGRGPLRGQLSVVPFIWSSSI